MYFLLYLLFFSSYRQSVYGILDYNLIPLKSISRSIQSLDSFHWSMLTNNLFGNILAFVPFGLFIPIYISYAKKATRMVLFSLTFSIIIELTQIIVRAGAFDIDDLILNSLGGLLGYFIYVLLCKYFPSFFSEVKDEKYKETH
jgi:glycopeptide antibiotics resistance protein